VLAADSSPTAYQLITEGNRYISEEAHDKVVTIHSDKSVGTTVPNIWYITYFDTDASLKAVTVKFGAGKKMDVDRPFRLLERANGDDQPLDRSKLKVDSDAALSTALASPLLANLNVKATQFWLEHNDGAPQWKVKIWAAKLKHPDDMADVGVVYISTETGKVNKYDLHPDHVD
jgi:hypothetical protein